MRRSIILLLVVSAAVAAACSRSAPQSQVARDILAARERWRRAGLSSYTFTSEVTCFCSAERLRPMIVTVRNGEVISVTDSASGAVRSRDSRQPIDSLFARLTEQAAHDSLLLSVQFDSTYGYPLEADFRSRIEDGEYFIRLSSLRPLP